MEIGLSDFISSQSSKKLNRFSPAKNWDSVPHNPNEKVGIGQGGLGLGCNVNMTVGSGGVYRADVPGYFEEPGT